MGKRRTNASHKDRHNDDDSDEVEEETFENEPLKPDQIANIKTRKKLIAKRRAPNAPESSHFGPFGSLNKPAAVTEQEASEKPAMPVFSGFKGFSAFKASSDTTSNGAPKVDTPPVSNLLQKLAPQPTSIFSAATTNKPELSMQTPPTLNLFSTKSTNGEAKVTPAGDSNKKLDTTTPKETETGSNISSSELNFINDLNELYEKYYGKSKRVLKLPDEVLNEAKLSGGDAEAAAKKNYALLLADLNTHCSKWISKHVEENPLVILTPICVDYFNYLILLEKSFYPNTFKQAVKTTQPTMPTTASFGASNGTSLFKSNIINNAINTPVMSFGSLEQQKLTNGHKEESSKPLNGAMSIGEADKENEREIELENDKNLIDSSKKFASLINTQTQQLNPISLTNNTSSFLFKPKEDTTPKLVAKDANSSPAPPSLFKFGGINTASATFTATIATDSKSESSTEMFASTIEPKKPSIESVVSFNKPDLDKPKLNLFASPGIDKVAPTFKFGADLSKPATTTTTSTLFGKKPNDKKESPSQAASFFSNLSKPAAAPASDSAAPPTFTSLMNSQSSSESNAFKSFGGFDSLKSQTPLFGATSAATEVAKTTTSLFGASTEASKPATPFFSFQTAGSKPGGIFGNMNASTSLFGSATFPASAMAGGGAAAAEGEAEEEEYVPPKPETCEVKEEGAVYTKRIKLFYFNEKESKFCDRGIGNLYLKPLNNGESTQLIVRADNTLGNILLNVKLNKVLPISKIGAKDVSYLCIPNPPIPNVDAKLPCKFLFKVKTEDDAVELLDKLNELKR